MLTLALREWPVPHPGMGQVRIRVHAAGVNFPDALMVEGRYHIKAEPPFIPTYTAEESVHEVRMSATGFFPFPTHMVARGAVILSRPMPVDSCFGPTLFLFRQ